MVECAWCGRAVNKRLRPERRQVCSGVCRAALREYDHGNVECPWSPPVKKQSKSQKPRRPHFIQGRCRWCGRPFTDVWLAEMSTRHCSAQCAHQEAKMRTRVRKHGAEVTDVARADILARDDWTCGICGEPIDRWRRSPELLAASIDHVVPLAHGGTHTADNLQAAHLVCNALKSDRELDGGLLV